MEPYLDFTRQINKLKKKGSREDFATSKRLNTDTGYVPPSYCE